MDKTISIRLTGHDEQFRLDEDAYDRLERYLDRAARRLQDDPERAEVLGDLERSVGDRLATAIGTSGRSATSADIDRILEEIGNVDTGREPAPEERPDAPPKPRRLHRIREGQQIAGVCNGLAEYAELDVGWVRTGFVLAGLFTAGFFILVYVALAFILPVEATRVAHR